MAYSLSIPSQTYHSFKRGSFATPSKKITIKFNTLSKPVKFGHGPKSLKDLLMCILICSGATTMGHVVLQKPMRLFAETLTHSAAFNQVSKVVHPFRKIEKPPDPNTKALAHIVSHGLLGCIAPTSLVYLLLFLYGNARDPQKINQKFKTINQALNPLGLKLSLNQDIFLRTDKLEWLLSIMEDESGPIGKAYAQLKATSVNGQTEAHHRQEYLSTVNGFLKTAQLSLIEINADKQPDH